MSQQIKKHPAFSEVRSNATSLFISDSGGNYADSMALLARKGLRPLTWEDALSNSSKLVKELKGTWFYINDKGIREEDVGYALEYGQSDYPLTKPFTVHIPSKDDAVVFGKMVLVSGDGSGAVAPVVVGMKIDPEVKEARRE